LRVASIDTTIVDEPNARDASRTSSGRATAAVFSDTLSAPARSTMRMSSTLRSPPPTVSGMKISSAVRRTISTRLLRPYRLATAS
jgi:hypothetical protein